MAAIPVVFVVGFAITIAYTAHRIASTDSDGLVIDLAGRQRALNQRYQREVLLVIDHAKADPGGTAAVLNETLGSLRDGGSAVLVLGKPERATLPPAPTAEIREILSRQERLIGELVARAEELRATPHDAPAFAARRQAMLDAGQSLHQVMSDAVRMLETHARQRIEGIVRIQMLFGALAILVGGLFARLIAVRIVRRLTRTVGALEALAQGDLTPELEVDSGDELGRMNAALNQAIASMRGALQPIAQSAQTLAASSEELTAVSQQVGSAAETTAAQSGTVSDASHLVTETVQTVAAAVEEMGASIREISRQTTTAQRIASEAVRSVETTNDAVAKLGTSSAEIGNVLKVITTIAGQTNLLALNATIEAARAGEYGKGFAVVANEVKALSAQTAKATEEITSQIEAIRDATTSTVTAIRDIGTTIGQMNAITETIAAAVEEQGAATKEIARSVQQAAQGTQGVMQHIVGVREASGQVGAAAAQVLSAAAQLGSQSDQLKSQTGHFLGSVRAA